MITNCAGTQAVCSLGWVHKGNLWVYKFGDRSPHIHRLSDSKYLSVKAGRNDFFSVVHHWDADRLEISAHHHSEPHRTISSMIFRSLGRGGADAQVILTGDNAVWQELPHAYVGYAFGDFHLFLVNPVGQASVQAFDWYDNAHYDKGYQGIVGVQEIPNSHLLIVSVQRDSNPVLYDPDIRKEVKKLSLAGRGGNPRFQVRISASELWADDYDHIVKLDAMTLNVIETKQLQEAGTAGRQFIGEFALCGDERLCLVARPFNGDAIGLDCDSMRQTHRAALGKQPLVAGLLGDDTVVALDWKTGRFLHGKLRKA